MTKGIISLVHIIFGMTVIVTIAAKPAASKRIIVNDCYTAVTTVCQSPNISLVFDVTPCLQAKAQDNKPIQSASGYQMEINCLTTENEFCCAQLAKTTQYCATHPRIDFIDGNGVSWTNEFAKIEAVFCRP